MPNLVKKHNISFELERKMVDAAVAKAREIGISENVVILDDGGNLKAFAGWTVPRSLPLRWRRIRCRTTSIPRERPWCLHLTPCR